MIRFEVVEDRHQPGCWRVEDIDFDGEGECHAALFIGNDAEARAREYADWKNAQVTSG